MFSSTRTLSIFAATSLFLLSSATPIFAAGGSDGSEQLGSAQSSTSETDAQLQVNYDPEPKITSVVVQSDALTFDSGSGTSSGVVDIGDLNVADGFALDSAFDVVISYSDTASVDELINLQAALQAASPAGFSIAIDVDTADIPSENNTLSAGGGGSAAGAAVALDSVDTTLTDLATDMDDNDTDAGPPAGDAGSIQLPVDMDVSIDSTVNTTAGSFTIKFRALFE